MDTKNIFDFECHEKTILIIDDDVNNLNVLQAYLETYGFEIMLAKTGEAGITIAQHTKPDLILLDIMMPGLTGFETCRKFKEETETKTIPVLFLSALSETEDKVEGFKAGGIDYVTKPIQQMELLVRINTHIKNYEMKQQLEERNEKLVGALDTGNLVNVAIGILIERHRLSRQEAFHALRNRSRAERKKIQFVAEEILDGAEALNLWPEDKKKKY